jgi:hypothetical protein
MILQQDFLTPMQELAHEAGSLLMSYFGKVAIEYKGDVDLVTVADRSSEALIVSRIRKEWPQHDLMGEEGSRRETGSDFRWYVDPLDGTTNFAHGYPVFCVSIALEYKHPAACGSVGRNRFSQSQTPQEPQHPLLSPDYFAFSWSKAGRVCSSRSVLRGQRTLRCFLGIQPESLGYCRRSAAGGRSGRQGHELY